MCSYTSRSVNSWFVFFAFTLHCSNSLFRMEDRHFASQDQKELAAHLSLNLLSEFNCINFISRGVTAEDILSDVYKMCVSPVVIGSNNMDFPCQAYFLLVNSSHQTLASVKNLRFRSRDHIIIFNVNYDCPEGRFLHTTLFGSAQLAVICSVKKSMYRLDMSGDLHVVTDNTKLFHSKTSHREDYMGRFLRVSTFNCPPESYGTGNGMTSSSYKEKSGALNGIEMKIFLEVAHHLNFTWRLEEPPEENKWGQKYQNGSWSGGIVGALVEGRADVGFCFLWLVDPQASDVDLTFPWNTACNTFLVPRPERLNKLSAVFLPFESTLWGTIIAATVFTATFLWILARFSPPGAPNTTKGRISWTKCLMAILGILTVASPTQSKHALYELRHVVNSWAVFTLLITTAYSSGLVSHLTFPAFSKPLDSIQALVEADIYWSVKYYPAMENLFDIQNKWHRRFIQKFRLYNEEFNHTKRRKHAIISYVLEGKVPHYLAGAPVHPGELNELRVMRDCMSRYFISLALSKKSPYTEAFNGGVVRLIESGIVQHWKQRITYESVNSTVSNLFEKDGRKNTGPEVLRMENIQGAFLLLAVGILMCILVFIAELSLNRMPHKQNHTQDNISGFARRG